MIPDILKEKMEFVGEVGIIKSWSIKHNPNLVEKTVSFFPVSIPATEFTSLIGRGDIEFVAGMLKDSPLGILMIHKGDSDFFSISCGISRNLPFNSSPMLVQAIAICLKIVKEKYSGSVLQWFVPEGYWDYLEGLFDNSVLKMVGTFSELKVASREIKNSSIIPCYFLVKDLNKITERDLFDLYRKTCENSLDCPEGHVFRNTQSTFAGLVNDPLFDSSISKVIYWNEKPVGIIFVSLEGKGLRVLYVGVLLEFRKRGVGSFIMNYLRSCLLEKHLEFLEVLVDESNFPAVKLYEKFGFRQLSRWKLLMTGKEKKD